MLGNKEVFILGNAIRESPLRTLHVLAANTASIHNEDSTLRLFFAGLLSSPGTTDAHPGNPDYASCGFPSSIIELAIEDDHET
jgi:hypothetical protein